MVNARRVKGSKFTQDDLLEISYIGEDEIAEMINTIEVVSGVAVTHGGGGLAGDYLHYKKDTDIDYSSLEMLLSQAEQGTSVIKVVSSITTQEQADNNKVAFEAWAERKEVAKGLEEEFTEEPPTPEVTTHKTGEITLDWTEDTFV